MSILQDKGTRCILPRWRDSKLAASNGDLQSLKAPRKMKVDLGSQLQDSVEQFEQIMNIGTAAELVSTALLSGQPDRAALAAQFIVDHQAGAPHTLIALAHSVTDGTPAFPSAVMDQGQQIAQTRRYLSLQPRNPVLWSDMARHYASLGERDRAMRCMKTALSLAPDHRWMLRTAARFWVHQGYRAEAHKLLAKHPRTRSDPWLIAAELACAQVAGKQPKYWKQANDILKFDAVAPHHISELATAVAMMELEAGDQRRGRRLVQKGLISPTENTLAQVCWAKENRHLRDGFQLDELVRSANHAYEADCQLKVIGGDLLAAQESARVWHMDEPFASRPCSAIAYIASLLDDHETTIRMAGIVRRIDGKQDPVLELNRIYATLSSGRYNPQRDVSEFERIRVALRVAIDQADGNSYHAVANMGLLYYRTGQVALGYETYRMAIGIAQKNHQNDAAAMAAIFAAREAILGMDPLADATLQQARTLVSKSKLKAAAFYMRKVEALAKAPEKAKEILSPSSVDYFAGEAAVSRQSIRAEHTRDGRLIAWVKGK